MDIYFWKTQHNVYSSLLKVFSFGNLKRYEVNTFLRFPTTHIENSKQKIDKKAIYITKSPMMSLFTWKLKKEKAKFFIFEEYFKKNLLKDFYAKLIFSYFKEAPFIAMTKRTKNFLEENSNKVYFIPPAEYKRNYSYERKYITMVSRLISSKNIKLFLSLAKEFPEEKFLIIGKGPLKDLVLKYKRRYSNIKYIEFVKEREDLFKFYSNSKLLIHPPFKDPIGFVVVESLSCSTPVLSSSFVGASDFLPEEWKLNSFGLKEWRNRLEQIIQNNEKEVKKASYYFKKEKLNIRSRYFTDLRKKIMSEISV